MTTISEKLDAIKALDRKKEIVEQNITRLLEMKETTESARLVIDNGHTAHNSFIVDGSTAQQIFTVIYTSLTTQREQLIIEAQKLIGPIEHEEAKENETAPA